MEQEVSIEEFLFCKTQGVWHEFYDELTAVVTSGERLRVILDNFVEESIKKPERPKSITRRELRKYTLGILIKLVRQQRATAAVSVSKYETLLSKLIFDGVKSL